MKWRLLDTGPCSAAENMAIDEAIMHSNARCEQMPTLRFYQWNPAGVSIGRHQVFDKEVNVDACTALGIDWVRRPTGGRAVLHDREVTYSVIISHKLLPGSVVETYRQLSEGIVRGLTSLGLPAELHCPRDEGKRGLSGACFDTPSWYELTIEGKKVVGSAQVRTNGVILQHGSIMLEFDAGKLLKVLAVGKVGDIDRLAQFYDRRAAGLSQVAGRSISYSEVCQAIAQGMSDARGITIEPGQLTVTEQEMVEKLARDKYDTKMWNEDRRDPIDHDGAGRDLHV